MIFKRICIYIFLFAFLFDSGFCDSKTYQDTYRLLTDIVSEKKSQLIHFCDSIKKKAESIQSDEMMVKFFKIKNHYYGMSKIEQPPNDIKQVIEELKVKIRDYYLAHYNEFYDILFINIDGDVFYTMRRESDYHQNIFEGELSDTQLSKRLKENPEKGFIDFSYFCPSNEPASFFVIPVYIDKVLKGWFALQCAVNKINSIFTGFDGLGATGEVFLVNKNQFMLTESRFIGDSTILKKHLNRDNICSKFAEKKGCKIVKDYRGFNALTSFEVFSFFSSEWLIIAKIDEDEVLTKAFKSKKETLLPKMIKYLNHYVSYKETNRRCILSSRGVKVDMDEFMRVNSGEELYTFGISTCTGVVVSYPEHFAYMAHLSVYDRMYDASNMYTDLIGQIIKRVMQFDIYHYQKRYLKAYVVANHTNSIKHILDHLLNNGFLLSQIYFIHNPLGNYATLHYDYADDNICAEWKGKNDTFLVQNNEIFSMAEILKWKIKTE